MNRIGVPGLLGAMALLSAVLAACDQGPRPGASAPAVVGQAGESAVPRAPAGYVADIAVHTPDELRLLFDRVEETLERPRSSSEPPLISLVLHGPEVEFFAFRNYDKYRDIVDRAAKLAALGAVDISICRTQMKSRGIAPDQVPAFLRQVPYGPGEVERLVGKGYVYM